MRQTYDDIGSICAREDSRAVASLTAAQHASDHGITVYVVPKYLYDLLDIVAPIADAYRIVSEDQASPEDRAHAVATFSQDPAEIIDCVFQCPDSGANVRATFIGAFTPYTHRPPIGQDVRWGPHYLFVAPDSDEDDDSDTARWCKGVTGPCINRYHARKRLVAAGAIADDLYPL